MNSRLFAGMASVLSMALLMVIAPTEVRAFPSPGTYDIASGSGGLTGYFTVDSAQSSLSAWEFYTPTSDWISQGDLVVTNNSTRFYSVDDFGMHSGYFLDIDWELAAWRSTIEVTHTPITY